MPNLNSSLWWLKGSSHVVYANYSCMSQFNKNDYKYTIRYIILTYNNQIL